MTKLLKKSLAVVLSVALCLSVMVCGFVASADGEPTITLVADNATPAAGDTVKIDVKVANFDAVAGAQFDVVLGDLALVEDSITSTVDAEFVEAYINVLDGSIRLVNENVDDELVAITTANGVLFSFEVAVPANAAAEDAFTVDFANAKFCEYGEGEPEVDVKAESVTLTVPVPAPVGPQPDDALGNAFTIYLGIDKRIGLGFLYMPVAGYADFEIIVTRQTVGDGYAIVDNTVTYDKNSKNEAGEGVTSMYYFKYDGIGLYEISGDITVTINGKDANGNITGTWSDTFSLAERLVAAYNAPTGYSAEQKTMYAELLWLGEAAIKKFQNMPETVGTEFRNLPSPVEGFTGVKGETYSAITGETTTSGLDMMLFLGVAMNPSITYYIAGVDEDLQATGKITASYQSNVFGSVSTEVALNANEKGNIPLSGANYFTFEEVALCDTDKPVTVVVTDGSGNEVASLTTSLALRLQNAIASASDYDKELYTRILVFGDAARAIFE